MHIVVIDYNGGNLASAALAAKHAAFLRKIDAKITISSDEKILRQADKLILPGQGAFADCAKGLEEKNLRPLLTELTENGTPFLGICVGMQLMAQVGKENGITPGLGWIKGEITFMQKAKEENLRLPHMGWNNLKFKPYSHFLTNGLSVGDHGYFVHSYALKNAQEEDCVATADYGTTSIPAIVAHGCRFGTQFHVEKSQMVGLTILGNFLEWQS